MYLILTDWKLFVKLLLSILAPQQSAADEDKDYNFANSMIMSRSPKKRNKEPAKQTSTAKVVPLNKEEKQAVTVQAYEDLVDVVNFLFLTGLGCIHLRAEWYLWTGANTHVLPT